MSVFVHLQVRSAYSLLYGPCSVEALVTAAAGMGYSRLALTDIDSLSGVHNFAEACADAGITPIFGLELTGAHHSRAVLLAQTKIGFSNLCQLVSKRKKVAAVADFDLQVQVSEHHAGVIVMTDDPLLLKAWHGTISQLYGLLTPRSTRAVIVAQRLGIPLVASCEAIFLTPEDREVQRVLLAIGSRRTVESIPDNDLCDLSAHLVSPEAVAASFPDFPEAVANSTIVADSIEFHAIFAGFIFPQRPSSGSQTVIQELRSKVIAGAQQRYGGINALVNARIEYELGIIEAKNFCDYFLVVADIVSRASRTCGRGSGAASIVSYCLGITNVDPIAHNLYFERFLNLERTDPPDIDVDFAWDERDKIIQSVIESYGADHCARVANHLHFQPRSAIRDVGRAFGIPDAEITAYERGLFRGGDSAPRDDVWDKILLFAQRIIGLPRGMSVHSGGIVITPNPVCSYAPIESAPSATILGWEKEGTEAAGLVKIDLLGNRSLAVIRDALANLARNGIEIDPFTWKPTQDPKTIDWLAQGKSMGVFYVESPAMRQLQIKTACGDFAHLVIHSSIIRPAANSYINEYVRRLKGGSYKSLHPLLDNLLDETYGIMCYQEDISKVAIAMADFSIANGDRLRKIVSKKSPKKLQEFAEKFRTGARMNGVNDQTIEEIWHMILSFEGYSFCKPHSASYAMVSFQSAYLKAHHGAEFMAAVISNQGGFYSPGAYISESRRMGIVIDAPDVNYSTIHYWAREGRIRIGLQAIRGLSVNSMNALIAERNLHGPFTDVVDFATRLQLARDELLALAESGALDSLAQNKDRRSLLFSLLVANFEYSRQSAKAIPSNARSQTETGEFDFGTDSQISNTVPPLSDLLNNQKLSLRDLRAEFERLGFLIDYHPLILWQAFISGQSYVPAKDLLSFLGKNVRMVGWPVTKKEVVTKNADPMEFFSWEDSTAIYESVLFPEVYDLFANKLDWNRPYWVYGSVEDDNGAIFVNVQRVEAIG